ncbi:ATP-binding cassette domain-containing protein [Apilactobacillus xinyiensis]|uniref:ATP-binding cassette domain-containing protein n=1 Tax=Apilactobacillus xinyiensis TaxID=2841032 RepID=UPI0020101DF7|nr:ATP-binding cassette domain-containing protein [Apilactobacillus xinyiensis]MCL0329812.1 ATP-binding cassette domain-containing protein [Apilactobacillus xinyiensis]
MGSIKINNLSFTYSGEDKPIFKNLSLNIDDNWHLGLIGRNGRGKTTFLKILMNELKYSGSISSSVKFNYFPNYNVDENNTVMQIMTSSGSEEWEAQIELSKIGLGEEYYYRKFNSLSGGEKTKVLIARGFINKDDFPLIDEPTNHLDIEGREVVGKYLKGKSGFICVSHDENFLDLFVDHILSINKETINVMLGNVEKFKHSKEIREEEAINKDKKLNSSINKLNANYLKQRQWAEKKEKESRDSSSRRTAKKLMRRAKTFKERAEKEAERKKGLLNDIDNIDKLKTNLTTISGPNLLLSFRSFSLKRDNKPMFKPFDIDFERGERLAIMGKNGVGKTSLLNFIIANHEKLQYVGYYLKNFNQKYSYLHQNFVEYLKNNQLKDIGKSDLTNVYTIMHQLGVKRSRLQSSVDDWSMGEAKKAAIAINLAKPNRLLFWDEPTNYLDIDAREQLIKLINDIKPTILMVDHDLNFIKKTTDVQLMLNTPTSSLDTD